ncbi:MAG: hypothetical protein WA919_22240 [Coleofasciculaceae cyanobacterium]
MSFNISHDLLGDGVRKEMNKYGEIEESNQGTVLSVRGSVIEAHFPQQLPEIYLPS